MVDLISPDNVANFLLAECREQGEVLTNLKLQKLLYYAQSWYLALNDVALFDEDFEAWVHGPVLFSPYQRFKKYEWRPIQEELNKPILTQVIEDHLRLIIEVFGSENAVSLELMTHRELPWQAARKELAPTDPSRNKIEKNNMRIFYKSLAQN